VTWKLEAPWREGAPDDAARKGPWWQRFGDAQLDALQRRRSQQPDAGAGRRAAAQARAHARRDVGRRCCRSSARARARRGRRSPPTGRCPTTRAQLLDGAERLALALDVSYEVDLAGRVQRSIEGATRVGEQSAADLENTRCVLSDRPRDELLQPARARHRARRAGALDRAAAARARDRHARHDLGAASGLDVAQQQALLDNTLRRSTCCAAARQFEHAIATLTGTPAPRFALRPTARVAPPRDAARRAVGPAGAPARRRLGRARDGGGQRADRRRQRGLLSERHRCADLGLDSRTLSTLFDAPSLLWSSASRRRRRCSTAAALNAERRLRPRGP
jgi:outer membrane protein TolC